MAIILGLCTMGSSSATIFVDGVLISAVEEERLSRVKNDGRFPWLAIQEVLSVAKVNISDVNEVCVYWQPWKLRVRSINTVLKVLRRPSSVGVIASTLFRVFVRSERERVEQGKWSDLFFLKSRLQKRLGKVNAKIAFHDHHLTHQLYAEAMSDWSSYLSLSYDGGGEHHSTVLVAVERGSRRIISTHDWPNSLGHFYSTFTGFLGFKMLEGEYKMMGLAPYGTPRFKDLILDKVLRLKAGGSYTLDTRICDYHAALKGEFSAELEYLFGSPRSPNEAPTQHHIDLAASVQAAFEAALFHVLEPAFSAYPEIKKLIVAGGCALNVTANGKLVASGKIDEVVIPPAPHDAGCAVGACLASRERAIDMASVRNPYLGRQFSDDEVLEALDSAGISGYQKLAWADLLSETAKSLVNKQIVAWFQGGAEFGPRALGNRSYLADPRDDDIRDELNAKIKKRELFRPFAPSVASEYADEFFDFEQSSPYMNFVARVRDPRIPAVTHTDGTARVHTVEVEQNPRYHELLLEFGRLTGVPVLLNTSFNIQEPIVYSPTDAIASFVASGVDVLVLGDYLIRRESL